MLDDEAKMGSAQPDYQQKPKEKRIVVYATPLRAPPRQRFSGSIDSALAWVEAHRITNPDPQNTPFLEIKRKHAITAKMYQKDRARVVLPGRKLADM